MSAEQALYGIVNGSQTVITRRQFIADFESFTLNHIPYAHVRPRDLQTGLIEFDGTDGGRPVLVWYFGGLPYPVARAARIDYLYVRSWDGSGAVASASIIYGFQSNGEFHELRTAPRHTFPVQRITPGANFVTELSSAVRSAMNNLPTDVVSGTSSQYSNLDAFVHSQLNPAAGPPARRGLELLRDDIPVPFEIEFDGPARDYDSHRIFAYTLDTLFNDREKFNQILWWNFAGHPQRITKALRIPLDHTDNARSMFIGFTGPQGYP